MSSYFLTPQAEYDLDQLARYIARDNIEAALKLYDMAKETFESLLETPLIGALYKSSHSDLKNIRFCSIKGFQRYVVFYKVNGKDIRIIRVLHSARDFKTLI
jgi:toxin ParE1/3/4